MARLALRLAQGWMTMTLLSVLWGSSAWGLPSTVFVYNHKPGDDFENPAEGFVFSSLGLLDAQGKPGTEQPNGAVTDGAGKKLGSAIRNSSNQTIGQRSLDGTKEAYNVNTGLATTDQAWLQVAPGGTLHIVKHGVSHARTTVGGGIALDGGETFDGFTDKQAGKKPKDPAYAGKGTKGNFDNGAYPLTPRPNANIKINVNGCCTTSDSDGNGPQRSVTDSAKDVTGVDSNGVTGHSGMVYAGVSLKFAGGTDEQQAAALDKLAKAARGAGYVKITGETDDALVERFIDHLPFASQATRVNQIIASTGATAALRYTKDENVGTGGGGCKGCATFRYGRVTLVDTPLTSDFLYTYDEPTDDLTAAVLIQPGDLLGPTFFQLNQLSEFPAPPPLFMRLASGMFDFRYLDIEPSLADPLDYLLSIIGDPLRIAPYFFDGTDWMRLSDFRFAGEALVATTDRVGILAAFETVPEPPSLVLVVFTLAIMGVVIRARGRRISRKNGSGL